MRRVDIEEVLGDIEAPDIEGGEQLLAHFFEIGPFEKDGPITWVTLDCWSRLTGIQLPPWQYQLLIELSKAYMAEMEAAKSPVALAPWEPARGAWAYVKAEQYKEAKKAITEARKGADA